MLRSAPWCSQWVENPPSSTSGPPAAKRAASPDAAGLAAAEACCRGRGSCEYGSPAGWVAAGTGALPPESAQQQSDIVPSVGAATWPPVQPESSTPFGALFRRGRLVRMAEK